jgi:hypothetical protein
MNKASNHSDAIHATNRIQKGMLTIRNDKVEREREGASEDEIEEKREKWTAIIFSSCHN